MNEPDQYSDDLFDPVDHAILIIDDIPANLSLVAENLSATGFQIKVAINGESGLKIAMDHPPTLILLDVHLPDLDGFEICRRLKADDRTREIPVIFMTAADQTESKILGFDVGGVDYITKPVNHQEVLARVSMQIRFKELTRRLKDAKQNLECRIQERTSELAQANEYLKKEISEREKIQVALIRSEQEYRNLSDNSPDSIARYDHQCHAIYCNPALSKALGLSEEEILGKSPAEITNYSKSRKILEFESKLRQVLQNGQPAEMELTIRHTDGEPRNQFVRFAAEHDPFGNIVSVLAIGRDITQRKKDEAALKHLNRELRAISDCNQVLVRAENEQQLLDDICHIICNEAGYFLAWVGLQADSSTHTIRPVASAGPGTQQGYIERLQESWTNHDHGLSGATLRSGEITCVNDFVTDSKGHPWLNIAAEFGYESSIALPLKDENQHTFGVLNIYSTEKNAFIEEEQRLLSELAEDLAFGIVTLRRRIEHNRAEEQIRIAATAFEAQEGIIITDAQKRILRVNAAFTEISGFTSEEAVGSTPNILKSDYHDCAYFQSMWDSIIREGAWQDEIWNRRKNGEVFPGWLNITAVKNLCGDITHYVGTLTDITERKQAAAEIEHLAYHDPLTLLPNRRLLLDRLDQALSAGNRSQHKGALLLIDLDNFKTLNDTRGHDAGDQLLIDVARRLMTCVRKGDTVARFGGDEFMILLKNLSSDLQEAAEQSRRIGEKILHELHLPYTIEGQKQHMTTSLGITLFSDAENSAHDLIKQTDIAMYQAKADGRNTLCFFDPEMQATVIERATLEAALRYAIEDQQFIVHYQPQIDKRSNIIGAELLLRWKHPERGMVRPDEFIPLAEETGLILKVGRWVLETACKQLKVWADQPYFQNLNLAVNVSQCQFREDDFTDQVRQILEETGAPPKRLKLELTESLLIDDIECSINKMHSLRALGVEFSLDDFGTGYSSLSYLTQLPLEQLKIDRSFISTLPDSHNDAVVVQTIITMAQSLKLSVIAEGVENEAQKQFLEQHGCTNYQGYLFSKPITVTEFDAFVATHIPLHPHQN
ncbi:PAS domain S-box-containing protein/diguanylate cyclase (GGDEF) domain-containing protein [Amphritea atlantica]|uniref:cyclic-guanylate-specific phosphodiesterase n=1 Tax=Amphritea atlantica TaxID=355243 RepID=A0A1H9JFC0_9GAMM|nr:EAL domain-containing protein [Amphritea atlantica]SEQ85520.1 PAS domain S-box-containing protein/diguanylate cyclase (GGDEF) domain-containing protein [Amphritea atlantica]